MRWEDFPEVSSLFCEPCATYTFDYIRNIFSTAYVEAQRFLSVIPEMMNSIEKYGGIVKILHTTHEKSVVGIAHVSSMQSVTQQHIMVLDFFLHDNYFDKTCTLVGDTIGQINTHTTKMIIAYCLDCDHNKKEVLKSLGAKKYAALQDYVYIGNKLTDVLIYKL
jgi:hypothetical protein